MRSIKAGLLFLILLLSSFTTSIFFQSKEAITTFKLYTSPGLQINQDLLETFEKGKAVDKKEATEKLIETTLKNLQYGKWMNYIEYIDLQIYRGHVLPNNNSQLIVVLNLSKDQAVIAIYDYINNTYIFNNKIEGLTPVESIIFVSLETDNYDYIVVNQILDERFGAYFYEKFMDIYLYSVDSFQKVWNKTLFYEETYKEEWINPNAHETIWNRVEEETLVDFIMGVPLKINTVTTNKKMVAQSKEMPQASQFTISDTKTFRYTYYWSSSYNTFILAELTKDVFLTKAALLQDMEDTREALYGVENKNYKLLTYKGEIIYLPKAKFQGLFKNTYKE